MRTAWSTALVAILFGAATVRADEPIVDFSPSFRYRNTVAHPALTIKPADLARARDNIHLHDWAKAYADRVRRVADDHAQRFTPDFVEHMLESTTPLSTLFTPCPACRDAGKTWHPHGQWKWSDTDPDRITCEVCGTVFPNEKYSETVEVRSHGATPQTFTFMGGEPFEVFNYKTCRPSITGCVRSHKVQFMTNACRELGEAYLIGGDERHARAVRAILLRLAKVYPHWIVHSGYGEIADTDSRTAVAMIDALPGDEIVYPPNAPDRRLFAGFWQAGRATGHGQEGRFVRFVVGAYDATCEAKDSSGRPIYVLTSEEPLASWTEQWIRFAHGVRGRRSRCRTYPSLLSAPRRRCRSAAPALRTLGWSVVPAAWTRGFDMLRRRRRRRRSLHRC